MDDEIIDVARLGDLELDPRNTGHPCSNFSA
jgi:hypothetical protein